MKYDPTQLSNSSSSSSSRGSDEEDEDEDEEEKRAKQSASWLQGVEASKAMYESAAVQLRTNLRMAHQVSGVFPFAVGYLFLGVDT
jgi:hypothetical protein